MATLRNRRNLAAVSRETPEGSRSSRAQNVFDPELTQEYISQVSEEIEGRVTKKLWKEFSKTQSRFLGALANLDEFLLNPQVRTFSVAVPETFPQPPFAHEMQFLHRSKTALLVMLSQLAADSANIVTPESEKKFRWVKCGLLMKSCTQSRGPRTSSSRIMTRSRLVTNFPSEITGPRTIRAASWKTYKIK